MSRPVLSSSLSILAAALCFAATAHAAEPVDGAKAAAAKAQYESERARCMSGATGQTQSSCLQSAGAAYQAALEGRLTNPNTDYRANAVARCRMLPANDQDDCIARVDLGVPQSDVRGGGSVQETVTYTVGPAVTPSAPASPAPINAPIPAPKVPPVDAAPATPR